MANRFVDDRRDELFDAGLAQPWPVGEQCWSQLEEHVDDLRDYIELRRARAPRCRRRLGGFVDALARRTPSRPDEMVDAFERAYWTRRLEALEDERRTSSPTTARPMRAGSTEFRRLDRRSSRPAPTG